MFVQYNKIIQSTIHVDSNYNIYMYTIVTNSRQFSRYIPSFKRKVYIFEI